MSKKYLVKDNIVLIANGSFPKHRIPLDLISSAEFVICCDGAANSFQKISKNIDIIIGDLDSLDNRLLKQNETEIIHIENQNDNDLRKGLNWISENTNIQNLSIIGATGLRDDHSIGNLASFLYNKYNFNIKIFTDTGCFYVLNQSDTINTFIGQPISLFCINDNQKITTKGLKYKLKNSSINLYNSTLNIAIEKEITISLKLDIPVLVYLCYENEKN